jgi:hypothetical protein
MSSFQRGHIYQEESVLCGMVIFWPVELAYLKVTEITLSFLQSFIPLFILLSILFHVLCDLSFYWPPLSPPIYFFLLLLAFLTPILLILVFLIIFLLFFPSCSFLFPFFHLPHFSFFPLFSSYFLFISFLGVFLRSFIFKFKLQTCANSIVWV